MIAMNLHIISIRRKLNMKMLVSHSCLTHCHPMDCSPPGSSVHGIVQARLVEWVAISFSRGIFPTQDVPWPPALQADSLPSESTGKP